MQVHIIVDYQPQSAFLCTLHHCPLQSIATLTLPLHPCCELNYGCQVYYFACSGAMRLQILLKPKQLSHSEVHHYVIVADCRESRKPASNRVLILHNALHHLLYVYHRCITSMAINMVGPFATYHASKQDNLEEARLTYQVAFHILASCNKDVAACMDKGNMVVDVLDVGALVVACMDLDDSTFQDVVVDA